MFQPLSSLFTKSPTAHIWDESDLKHLAQSYLREELKTHHIYCAGTSGGVLSIRVKSPTLKQAVHLLEYDLQQLLESQAKYKLKKLDVKLE